MRRQSDTLRPGDRAPEFALQDASGQTHSLNDLLAGKADLEGRPLQGSGEKVPAYTLLVFDRGTW